MKEINEERDRVVELEQICKGDALSRDEKKKSIIELMNLHGVMLDQPAMERESRAELWLCDLLEDRAGTLSKFSNASASEIRKLYKAGAGKFLPPEFTRSI